MTPNRDARAALGMVGGQLLPKARTRLTGEIYCKLLGRQAFVQFTVHEKKISSFEI